MNFLHAFDPSPILLQIGPITVYYYGALVVSGMIAAGAAVLKLAPKYGLEKSRVLDLLFWLVVWGLIGARLYHVLLELPYYLADPLGIIKVWNGGLAVHGGIFAGAAVLYAYGRKNSVGFWLLSALIAPGLALAQAIGRWGNYFNQELFGAPTSLPWGIPIDPARRPAGFLGHEFFHPAFLYESAGNLAIFIILSCMHRRLAPTTPGKEPGQAPFAAISLSYLVLYSLLRFGVEFIRLDPAPSFFALRLPQIVSLLIILAGGAYLAWPKAPKPAA